MNSALRFAAPLVLASLVLSLSACKSETPEAETEASAETAETAAAEAGAPIVEGIEGLETERAQVSYMIGLDIGRSMSVVKQDLDLDVVRQAMEDAFEEREPKITDEQMKQIQDAFTVRLQARKHGLRFLGCGQGFGLPGIGSCACAKRNPQTNCDALLIRIACLPSAACCQHGELWTGAPR